MHRPAYQFSRQHGSRRVTHTQPFNGLRSGTTRVGRYQKKHSHPSSSSDVLYHLPPFTMINGILFVHFTCLTVLSYNLSRSSLVFLLFLDPQLHTPYISSPNHRLLFAAHANAACSAATPMLCHLSLNSLLGSLSFGLTPHIHLTILISARWSATTFSFLTG